MHIDGPAPAPGTMITAGGRDAGELRSSRDGQGIALLRLDAVGAGTKLLADAATLVPLRPDWMRVEGEDAPHPNPRPASGEGEGSMP